MANILIQSQQKVISVTYLRVASPPPKPFPAPLMDHFAARDGVLQTDFLLDRRTPVKAETGTKAMIDVVRLMCIEAD